MRGAPVPSKGLMGPGIARCRIFRHNRAAWALSASGDQRPQLGGALRIVDNDGAEQDIVQQAAALVEKGDQQDEGREHDTVNQKAMACTAPSTK